MSKKTLALITATIVSIIYGMTFTIAKDVMPQYVDAYGFIIMRVGGASILFWLAWFFSRKSSAIREEQIDPKDYPRIIAAAFFWRSTEYAVFLQRIEFDFAHFGFGTNGFNTYYCTRTFGHYSQGTNAKTNGFWNCFRTHRHCFSDTLRKIFGKCHQSNLGEFSSFHQCKFLRIVLGSCQKIDAKIQSLQLCQMDLSNWFYNGFTFWLERIRCRKLDFDANGYLFKNRFCGGVFDLRNLSVEFAFDARIKTHHHRRFCLLTTLVRYHFCH